MLIGARLAGLNGRRLPNYGAPLHPDWLRQINATYEIARNERAARGKR